MNFKKTAEKIGQVKKKHIVHITKIKTLTLRKNDATNESSNKLICLLNMSSKIRRLRRRRRRRSRHHQRHVELMIFQLWSMFFVLMRWLTI